MSTTTYSVPNSTQDTSTTAKFPLVIISSLRPHYLEQVLLALEPQFRFVSPRVLFVHKHQLNDIGTAFEATMQLAVKFGFTVNVFEGLHQTGAAQAIMESNTRPLK